MYRTAGPLFRDGRQPRQFERQPCLGLRPGSEHRRQGLLHLAEPERARPLRSVSLNRRVAKGGNTMRNTQSGVSIMALIMILVLVAAVSLFGMKEIPPFLQYHPAQNTIHHL